ncbi:LytR/AlgR family response regulator transcription factor [Planctobacterium marinum]|uniref:DNA-binding response regulator n=1 Tax=Planctobacterium marinum TaxID=1631968 RepID=A0AA48HIW0_9ALTE|nr:DNA-binding response regulator [Planctobacterium marinum]
MFKALIVDDERLARAELKRLLAEYQDTIKVVAEAANADAALEKLASSDIDLVFLDVQMPGMTGVELAERIDTDIQFVFCTAFDQYAVDAFTLNAVDYLVKPINPQRLSQCIQKLQQDTSTTSNESGGITTENYLPDQHGLLLKFGDVNRIVKLAEIERFESVGNHCAVYSPSGKSWVHSSLSKVESRLDPRVFFKASRSELIRVDAIERIESGIKTGSFVAILISGQHIELSRRQAQTLKQLFSAF